MHHTFSSEKSFSTKKCPQRFMSCLKPFLIFPSSPTCTRPSTLTAELTSSFISTSTLPCSDLGIVRSMSFVLRKSWMWILAPPLTSCMHLGLSVLLSKMDTTTRMIRKNCIEDHEKQCKIKNLRQAWCMGSAHSLVAMHSGDPSSCPGFIIIVSLLFWSFQ